MNRRFLLIFVSVVVGLFTVNYLVAWFQSQHLSNQYFQDAESAYSRGEFLEALTGYEEYDEQQGEYIQRGGYQQVERIWAHPYAWPRPVAYMRARERIQEIIDQRLTIPMAEAFVQANIGKKTPYLGIIYLRLGELYEESGDSRSAIDIYREVLDFFPGQANLVSRANDHLARLGVAP
jgi:tetratricopeptide (TPR) repeat protein